MMASESSTHTHLQQEQALLDYVEETLGRELPLREGPYVLAFHEVPAVERATWGGQRGPVLRDNAFVSAYLRLEGLDRKGNPCMMQQSVCICPRAERERARVAAIIKAFARVARRAMHDVQDTRFGDRPWLGLTQLACAMHTLHESKPRKRRFLERYEAILLAAPDLRRVLAPSPAETDAAVAALDAWLAAHRTLVKTPTVELVHVPEARWDAEARLSPMGVEAKRFGLSATLRLILSDEAGVRDIKEQQVRLVPAAAFSSLPRMLAFLDGWAAVLPRALSAAPASDAVRGVPRWRREIDACIPHDMIDGDVIALKKPRTAGDFEAAFAKRWKIP